MYYNKENKVGGIMFDLYIGGMFLLGMLIGGLFGVGILYSMYYFYNKTNGKSKSKLFAQLDEIIESEEKNDE